MMISLSEAGKRFNREWIFRDFNYTFEHGSSYAITGPNGSGKSTLLQVLGGALMLNEGKCEWAMANGQLSAESVYRYISICAPYLELVEEMTLNEFLGFHFSFKKLLPGITIESIITSIGLEKASHKQIRNFSSGMKQRLKLAQCIFSDNPVLLLDEPCTNLDTQGIGLYHTLIDSYCGNRLVIVSSNDEVEYRFCSKKLDILSWKNKES